MDIERKDLAQKRKRKRIIGSGIAVLVIIVLFVALGQIQPAAPHVDKGSVWIDSVKRGTLTREIRGIGTLVPENNRLITALSSGVVEAIFIYPGAKVEPQTPILQLSNPQLIQDAASARFNLDNIRAKLENQKILLESNLLQMQSELAELETLWKQSQKEVEVNSQLFEEGLLDEVTLERARLDEDQYKIRNNLGQKRLVYQENAHKAQLNMLELDVKRLEAEEQLLLKRVDNLSVRGGIDGILQKLPVEVGQQVSPGEVLAQVADPNKLKAVIKIQETQARDIQVGQKADVDTRNGIIEGRVVRIDPSVEEGTVTVDIQLLSEYPRGARPDLTVEGTIQLDQIEDTLYVGRPAYGRENSTMFLFKFEKDSATAIRTPVRFGRSSASEIEILEGLEPGDRIILSDVSQWEDRERIQVN